MIQGRGGGAVLFHSLLASRCWRGLVGRPCVDRVAQLMKPHIRRNLRLTARDVGGLTDSAEVQVSRGTRIELIRASVCDKYKIGPSFQLVCTMCCFTD